MMWSLSMTATKILSASLILLPFAGCAALLFISFFSLPWKELWIERMTRTIMATTGFCSLLLVGGMSPKSYSTVISFHDWIVLPETKVGIHLILDTLALTYLITSGFISAIVGYFSARYLHRDPGYLRFFTLYLLFVSGLTTTILAGNLAVLVVGWELVGLSSVLLVGFYRERRGPVDGAIVVFTAYRIGDLGLHGLTISLPILFGSDLFPTTISIAQHAASAPSTLACSLLILLAAACKSAQGPFSIWLPRAMEGPTPSSAIFYGALSVHLGAYLLLRTSPIWHAAPIVPRLIVGLGLFTAFYGATVGRTRSDIKSLLSYASMAQLGLIFAEIGMGWEALALWHMTGHAMLRTLQFLRSPSAISDWQRFGRLQGWHTTGQAPLESGLGFSLSQRLYKRFFFGWGLEKIIREWCFGSILRTARICDTWGQNISRIFDRPEVKVHITIMDPRRDAQSAAPLSTDATRKA